MNKIKVPPGHKLEVERRLIEMNNFHLSLRQDTQQLIRDLEQKEPFITNMNERRALNLLREWLKKDNKE